jgi:DNA-binding NarL/FixJ family response regulator
MLQSGGGELKAPHTTLSAREYQVFTLLLHGRAVADIAAELNVGSSTVSNHVAAIRNKLGVKSIVEIVRYGVREGLVDDLPVHATEPE